jgi:xanthine dehydrogenase YagS FAD-binding subunit
MAVAMAAIGGEVHVLGSAGTRTIPLPGLHRLPGDEPERDTVLAPGDLITAVELSPLAFGARSRYRKVRDRASYAFALVSVAAIVQKDGSGRVALGGVAPKPWRNTDAEAELPHGAKAVTDKLLAGAQPTAENAFKLPLAERTLAAALMQARA